MTSFSNEFTIGELSRRADVKIETIRYYEKTGVMPDPPRTAGGFRLYRNTHLKRLRFVRRCRQLGFAMAEIRELLGLVDAQGYTCSEVQAMTLDHAERVREKITDLERLQTTLREIASMCTGNEVPDCPIVDALMGPEEQILPPA